MSQYIENKESLNIEYREKYEEVSRFMQKVDNIENRNEHNLYNELITLWSNFNSANYRLLIYKVKIEVFYLFIFLTLLASFDLGIFMFVVVLTLSLVFIIMPKVFNIRNYYKTFTNKLGEISNFVEEYMKNKIDRYIFSDKKTVNTYVKKLLKELKIYKKVLQQKEDNILYIYDIIMYVILLSIFCYMIIGFIYKLRLKYDSIMICFILVYLLFNSLKPTIFKAIEIAKFNSMNFSNVIQQIDGVKEYSEDDKLTLNDSIYSISLKNLTFSYNNKSNLLKNINAKISESQLFLISGDNGTGKTTLLNLILGLEKGNPDEIIFKNNENKIIKSNSSIIKRNFSYYSPEQYLNYTSTKSNITYDMYNSNPTLGVKNFFNLNLDKVILYNGENISSGEKQKILLSRCLNKESQVYIFDEPTSNLDSLSKKQLIKILFYLKNKKKLIIVVTHDPEIKKLADVILDLNLNKIKEKKIE